MSFIRRLPVRVAIPVLLMAVLALLAALQYHWLGQISVAERDRMRETMTARARALALDIDRELSRVYVSFQLRQPELDDIEGALSARYQMWQATSRHPGLLTGIYLVPPDGTIRKFDAGEGRLTEIGWPAELESIRRSASETNATPPGSSAATTFVLRLPSAVNTDPLALSVVMPFVTHRARDGAVETRVMTAPTALLLVLDRPTFVDRIVPTLVAQHFADSLDDYRVSIINPRVATRRIYSSTPDAPPLSAADADVHVDTLSLRPGLNERLLATEMHATAAYAAGLESGRGARPDEPERRVTDRITLFINQIPGRSRAVGGGVGAAGGQGAWQVLLKHRAGSLEAAVEGVRRRNLVMSFGMLALLGVSVGLVLVSARRAERLASQQMDFVATVSHELRTPLAVIRSAGQNLAAGVVQDPKRYGELIETEGKRLTDMVEQTLALAGLSGDRRPAAQQLIDPGDVVRSVLASPEITSRTGEMAIELRVAAELPLVLADEMLLWRGVQNLVANAIKYGSSGGWIGVSVDASGSRRGREVRITVSDRGPGIGPEDLPNIFDAFYRGRRAVSDQVQGNGLGLHLVKRIAEAHGGRVSVKTSPGGGASFTIHLPASSEFALPALAGEEPQTS